jgi:hypothetical protein
MRYETKLAFGGRRKAFYHKAIKQFTVHNLQLGIIKNWGVCGSNKFSRTIGTQAMDHWLWTIDQMLAHQLIPKSPMVN